jgi:phage/plasmid-associated DNA primase
LNKKVLTAVLSTSLLGYRQLISQMASFNQLTFVTHPTATANFCNKRAVVVYSSDSGEYTDTPKTLKMICMAQSDDLESNWLD